MRSVSELLEDITLAVKSSRSGLSSSGRLARTPDYRRAKISSSRPKSDRGVTFHFAHKSISKRNDVSESKGDATSAPSHQSYIERLEAVDISDKEMSAFFDSEKQLSLTNTHSFGDGFKYPELKYDPLRASFGTLGDTKADRVEFWRNVEANEGRTARVQNRIIAELPHEATHLERLKMAVNFCKTLAENKLPYWATIHSPTKANDARNFHLHIAYFDRPAGQDEKGSWDFTVTEKTKKKNRVTVERRPFKRAKEEVTRSRDWVKFLRLKFAAANNAELEKGRHEKRLDPRSYQESGVTKSPTEHLGFKSNAAEKFGLDTVIGRRNAKKEIAWKVQSKTSRWEEIINERDSHLLFKDNTQDEGEWQNQKALKLKLIEGRDTARRSAQLDILSDVVTARMIARNSFLRSEKSRINKNEKLRKSPEYQMSISLIDIEEQEIATRAPDLINISQACSEQSRELSVKEEQLWVQVSAQHTHQTAPEPQLDDVEFEAFFNASAPTLTNEIFVDEPVEDTQAFDDGASNIADLFGEEPKQQASIEETKYNLPAIPGVLLVPDMETRKDLTELNDHLKSLTNRDVRIQAITSRDASEFIEDSTHAYQANRGWIVLREEAKKRGIDLATGTQDRTKATDQERAKLHSDQGTESVLEIRQRVVTVMAR